MALWERTTAPASKGVLVMDLSRRAWNGSTRARAFYDEQQRRSLAIPYGFLSRWHSGADDAIVQVC